MTITTGLSYQKVNTVLNRELNAENEKREKIINIIKSDHFAICLALISAWGTIFSTKVLFALPLGGALAGCVSALIVGSYIAASTNNRFIDTDNRFAKVIFAAALVACAAYTIISAGPVLGSISVLLNQLLPFGIGLLSAILCTQKSDILISLLSSRQQKAVNLFSRNDVNNVSNPDVYQLLKTVNSKPLRVEIIAEMNFEQLTTASETLDRREFIDCIKNVSNVAHILWKHIDLICTQPTLETTQEALSNATFKALGRKEKALYSILDRELRKLKPQFYEKLRPVLENDAPEDSDLRRIPIEIKGYQSLLIKKSAFNMIDGTLRDCLSSTDTLQLDEKKKELPTRIVIGLELIGTPEDYKIFTRFVQRLNGELMPSTTKELLDELAFANKWSQDKAINLIEEELEKKTVEMSDQQLYQMTKERVEKQNSVGTERFHSLRQKVLKKFLPDSLTEETFDKYWNVACDLAAKTELRKLIPFVTERLKLGPLWIKRFQEICEYCEPSELIEEYTAEKIITKETVRVVYDIATKKLRENSGDAKLQAVIERCVDWAKKNGLESTVQAWGNLEIPKEILKAMNI